MATKTYLSAFLIFVVLSSSVYFLMPGEIRIDIKKTLTTYAVFEDGKYVLAATEYVYLYDGSTKMRASSRVITYHNDSDNAYAIRTSNWKDDITTIQTYKFGKSESDVENLPLENKFECINCQGKFVQFEIRDILYDGETKNIESGFSFGHNMKIDFDDNSDFSWAKVYQQTVGDKIIVKFKADEPVEEYSVRLYDPEQITNHDWIIEGDSIYMNDSNVYIYFNEHTSNQPVIDFKTKSYSGDVDLVVGFNTDGVIPKKAETNPHLENITKSYTCPTDYFDNNATHAWCYENIITYDESNITNGSYLNLIFEHNFDTGSIPTKTIYWDEEQEVWNDISGGFELKTVDFMGYNKWYVKSGVNVNAEQLYKLRLTLQNQDMGQPSHKYFWGVKPSSMTLQEAIDTDNFYYIDPWTESLETNLLSYWKLEEDAGSLNDSLGIVNGTAVSATQGVTGKIGNAVSFSRTSSNRINLGSASSLQLTDHPMSISAWINKTATGSSQMIFGASDLTGGYGLYIHGDEDIGFGKPGIDEVAFTDKIQANVWTHVLLVYDTDSVSLYLNGTLDGAGAQAYSSTFGTGKTYYIGMGSTANEFGGTIDEVSIWDRALNSSEATQLYNNGDGITYSVANINITGTLKDSSGSGIVGVIYATNQETNTTTSGKSDSSGDWIVGGLIAGNYTVSAYDNQNSTVAGDIKPWVVVTA